jgi:hypothetical protein
LLAGGNAHADDLLVVGNYYYGSVWRFDATSGAASGEFGYDNEGFYSMSLASENEICVTSNTLGLYSAYRFNRAGQFLGSAADLWGGGQTALTRGPDGNLYGIIFENYEQNGRVVRFDGPTPTDFVPNGSGGMLKPVWMLFGPDGRLYVADNAAGILRFDAATGAFIDTLVPMGRGGLQDIASFAFGPDGRLYVASGTDSSVLRFNPVSGAAMGPFIQPGSGGLSAPRGLAFGPEGDLFVSSRDTRQVLRYDGRNGRFLGVFATLSGQYPYQPGNLAVVGPAATDSVWFDDELPAGAWTSSSWTWTTDNPAPHSGTRAHRAPGAVGMQEHAFVFATDTMNVAAGDSLFVYVNVNYSNRGTSEIMLSWCDETGWEHRAWWGADSIPYGAKGTASRRYMGVLPRSGSWARLEVPAKILGLEGHTVSGMGFASYDADATFDDVGKSSLPASEDASRRPDQNPAAASRP